MRWWDGEGGRGNEEKTNQREREREREREEGRERERNMERICAGSRLVLYMLLKLRNLDAYLTGSDNLLFCGTLYYNTQPAMDRILW